MSSLLPGKSRRASVYAAGTPITSARKTTAKTTSTVTHSIESSWNSFQAAVYHVVVQPSGSHVPSQRLAKELVATAAIIRPMLTTKSVIRPSSRPRQARSNHACRSGRAAVMRLAFSSGDRAAIEDVSKREDRCDDDELHQAHNHRDRGRQRIVVLLERRLVRRDGDHACGPGGGTEQDGGGKHRECLHERQAKAHREPGREERKVDVPELGLRTGPERGGRAREHRIDAGDVGKDQQECKWKAGDHQRNEHAP